MNRCQISLGRATPRLFLGALALALSCSALAQNLREFPKSALRATLVITAAPQIALDGRPDRLSPGSRIRNAQNMLVMSGTLVGQELLVNYTRESAGMVHEVWILTPAEAALKRPGASQGSFGSDYPSAPVPYNQLPKYPS